MRRILLLLGGTWLILFPCARLNAAGKFTLKDGDRVVFIGNTLIEREQRYGYWETALTSHYPGKKVIFRNLGWSGDTVFGDAQAGFGSAADGFRHLQEHVLALKPTVIFLGYGFNESFKGKAGLPEFRKGLDILLKMLAQTKARIVIVSPLRQENLGRPLPDPTGQNKNIGLYRDALEKVADKHGYPFVDLYDVGIWSKRFPPPILLTDNGIHLTAFGYWVTAAFLESNLDLAFPRWRINVDTKGKSTAQGATLVKDPANLLSFKVTDNVLPVPPRPLGADSFLMTGMLRKLSVRGLAPGKYTLKIDGKTIMTSTAKEWARGSSLILSGPEFEQVERLRKTIIAKNRLYFHRWRPQNETYLFGFRKHEQGKNAKEIVQFDPLIAKAEMEIARLRVPVTHQYEIVPDLEKKK